MLRFKRDDGTSYPEWEEPQLEKYCYSISSGKTKTVESKGRYILYGSTGEIGRTNNEEFSGEYVLVARVGANAGTVNLRKGSFGVSDNTIVIKNKETISSSFLYYLLYKYNLKNLMFGSGQPLITSSQLKKLKLKIPHMEEQQKIADFILEVDNIIASSKQEIESLEMQKKGAMQKIFSQEVRFKADDGSEYPAWEEKKMDNICSFFSGGTPTSSNADYYGGEIPFIRSGEIHLTSTELFITDIGLKASSAKMVNIGDILYALCGATSGEVDISKINGAINQAILCIRPDKYQSSIFIKELLNHNKDKIVKTFLRGGQGNLSAYTIKNLKYEFPCFEERQKIADFLSEFDNAIEYAKEELEIWQNIKKGLLQQMFE